ncbi:MAG TPA: 5'/3'-nucleotidase SurE [Frankiaceae bacterium]|nr:5'/3'-nucleotidase SurE [Frankiaceae bacterium]
MSLPRRNKALALVVASLGLAACSGSGSSGGPPAGPAGSASAATGISILVTNDDGVTAPGIDILVNRLRTLPNVAVTVVAPADNRSGAGGRTTPGALRSAPAATASGYQATAVDGYPADTVRVALDDLKLHPRLVVSGINKGQNIGPIAAISGTVGAARAAAQRGIPAIAVSTGTPAADGQYDFAIGADYAIREVQKELTSPPNPATIANLNVPSCATGQVRGLQELPAENKPDVRALATSSCTSTRPPSTEVGSFVDGFAVLTRIPARP